MASPIASGMLNEEQFQCSICLDVFTEPVTTPCGHSFCKACISSQWDDNEIQCQCPKCHKRFHNRPEVSTNSVMQEISVQIKRRRLNVPECPAVAAEGEVACDVCTDRGLKALKSCLVCQTSYCETHLEPHQRVAALKDHKLIDPVRNLEDRICRNHRRPLEMFCRDHRVNSDKELVESQQLLSRLFCSLEERQTKLHDTIQERQEAAERYADQSIKYLEQEITELRRRSTELELLSHTEDHLHLLQRFTHHPAVMGEQRFNSGRHYWEVQVGAYGRWDVGVATETIDRKKAVETDAEHGFFAISKSGFQHPVSIPCGHRFCLGCIGEYWRFHGACECPLCKVCFPVRPRLDIQHSGNLGDGKSPPLRAGEVACDVCPEKRQALRSCLVCLASYCEVHLQPHYQDTALGRHQLVSVAKNLEDSVCRLHGKKLDRFCRSDQTCVCYMCVQNEHRGHRVVAVSKEAKNKKVKLKRSTTRLQQMILEQQKKVDDMRHSVAHTEATGEKQNEARAQADKVIYHLEQEISELQRRSTELEQLSYNEDHLHLLQLQRHTIAPVISPFAGSVIGTNSSQNLMSFYPSDMASLSVPVYALEQLVACPICQDVFENPVTTGCGHSFCRGCLEDNRQLNGTGCPLCKQDAAAMPEVNISLRSVAEELRKNKASHAGEYSGAPGEVACDVCTGRKRKALKSCLVCLASYCETHLEPHSSTNRLKGHKLVKPVADLDGRACLTHGRALELYDRKTQRCICALCVEEGQDVVSVETEWGRKKEELQSTKAGLTTRIKEKESKVEEINASAGVCKGHLKGEIQTVEEVFKDLEEVLDEAEKTINRPLENRMHTVETEAGELTQELQKEIYELRETIAELDDSSALEDHIQFLQTFPSLSHLDDKKDWKNVAVDTSFDFGTLRSTLVAMMEKIQLGLEELTSIVDVKLDTETAHPRLVVSDDGKEVRDEGESQSLPRGPNSFDCHGSVLALKKLVSGKSYWEVEEKPQKVGVFVDYEEGLVSFYDLEARSHIYSFTKCCFTRELYPYFSPHLRRDNSLQVCHCGWSRFTTWQGLRTHQGMTGCTPKGLRIAQYEQDPVRGWSPPTAEVPMRDVRRRLWQDLDASARELVELGSIKAKLTQGIQVREKKAQELRASAEGCKDHLELEKGEIKEVFAAVRAAVERAEWKVLQPLEERAKHLEQQAENMMRQLQQEIQWLRSTINELQAFPSLPTRRSLQNLEDGKDLTEVTLDTSCSFSTMKVATSSMVEQIELELEKLSSIEMKRIPGFAVDVKLDTETANPRLVVSDDGKEVRDGGESRSHSSDPNRFDCHGSVLALNKLVSGKSYWEVEIRNKTGWDLGVTREDANRKGRLKLNPLNGYWVIVHYDRTEYAALSETPTRLSLKEKPQKVGVFVDYEEGLVSFYDVEARSHIYSFTKCCFTRELYPYFSPHLRRGDVNSGPLIISPVKRR
ncbi:uncharacterized protein FYW47_015555 [Aplochiton taeniatus]